MADPGGSARVRLRPAVEWRRVDGEIVALDLISSSYVSINGSGAVLWPSLDAGATRETLVARLVEEFDLSQGDATHDVHAFLAELSRLRLLEE